MHVDFSNTFFRCRRTISQRKIFLRCWIWFQCSYVANQSWLTVVSVSQGFRLQAMGWASERVSAQSDRYSSKQAQTECWECNLFVNSNFDWSSVFLSLYLCRARTYDLFFILAVRKASRARASERVNEPTDRQTWERLRRGWNEIST